MKYRRAEELTRVNVIHEDLLVNAAHQVAVVELQAVDTRSDLVAAFTNVLAAQPIVACFENAH